MTRNEIRKTYKLFIGGQFPRTESGRYIEVSDKKGRHIANICRASRKDLRNAVEAARKSFPGWSARSAFNRSQILYRVAEMLEGRRGQFISELKSHGLSSSDAETETSIAIDFWVYFAGWCDKYQQIFGSVNPVSSDHFNFSTPVPTGVCGIIAPENYSLSSLSYLLASALAGGNTVVVLASENNPLPAITLAEVVSTSDVPGGVVNILTGLLDELHSQFSGHMDINALIAGRGDSDTIKSMEEASSGNVKRFYDLTEKFSEKLPVAGPGILMDLQEIKTTWHPIEKPVGLQGSY